MLLMCVLSIWCDPFSNVPIKRCGFTHSLNTHSNYNVRNQPNSKTHSYTIVCEHRYDSFGPSVANSSFGAENLSNSSKTNSQRVLPKRYRCFVRSSLQVSSSFPFDPTKFTTRSCLDLCDVRKLRQFTTERHPHRCHVRSTLHVFTRIDKHHPHWNLHHSC